MSREVDLSKRLSEEDANYLLARGREQEVIRNIAEFDEDADLEVQRAASYIPGTSVDEAEGVPVTPGGDPLVNNGGGIAAGVPTFADAPHLAVDGEAGDAGVGALQVNYENSVDGETEDNYETWTKKQLRAEIEERNKELPEEEQMAVSGDKPEMVSRLRQHDAELAESDEDEDGDAEDDDE